MIKRFTIDKDGITVIDNYTDGLTECKYSQEAKLLCNFLNEITEENEQLKASNILLKNEMSWIKDCAYWREKEAFNKLFGYYMITVDEYRLMEKENQILIKQQEALQETTLYEAIKYARELEDSNTELYNENMKLKRLIKDAYETERTMLGKSVLKQLLDQM